MMHPKDAAEMATCVDYDQTASLFAETYQFQFLEFLNSKAPDLWLRITCRLGKSSPTSVLQLRSGMEDKWG